jgi:hypothetical protein
MEYTRNEVINRTEKANSFEFGKAGQRHKVYYDVEEDLKKAIDTALAGEKYWNQITLEGDGK